MRPYLLWVLAFALAGTAQDKPKLDLHGDRFPGLAYEQLTPAQRLIADRALSGRGTIGIFNITLRSPELSDAMRGITGGRSEPLLSTKQNELAILITGRFWTTQYEWSVHHRAAAQAGLSEDTISAIREGRRPATLEPDQAAIYNFLTALLNTKQVSDGTFQALKEQLGEKRIVDLIALVGFYQTVSLMMNVDRYPLTSTQRPELEAIDKPVPFTSAASPETSNGVRFAPLRLEEMTARQKALSDLVESGKLEGGTEGLAVLLRSPELGEAILRYGAYERFHMPLPSKLRELTALITSRNWSSQYLWHEHRRVASEAGLSEAVIKNIAEGKRPVGLSPDEDAAYDFCTELLRTTQMTDATFGVAKRQLGERAVVEIMGAIGYYQTAAMLLNTARYPLPAGIASELTQLANPIPASLPAQTDSRRAEAPKPAAATMQVQSNLNQLMRGVLYPAANVVFSAQSDDPATVKRAPGVDPSLATDPLVSTFGGWLAVENAALALTESANLLLIPGRECANGVPAPINSPDWTRFVQDLRDAGITAYKAAQTKDQDKMIEASDTLTKACAGCHRKWREKPKLADRCK